MFIFMTFTVVVKASSRWSEKVEYFKNIQQNTEVKFMSVRFYT